MEKIKSYAQRIGFILFVYARKATEAGVAAAIGVVVAACTAAGGVPPIKETLAAAVAVGAAAAWRAFKASNVREDVSEVVDDAWGEYNAH